MKKTYDLRTLHAKNMKLTGSTIEGSYTEVGCRTASL